MFVRSASKKLFSNEATVWLVLFAIETLLISSMARRFAQEALLTTHASLGITRTLTVDS